MKPHEEPETAEDVFERWLQQREMPGAPDLEELCRRHPAHADELRGMAEDERVVDLEFAGLPDPEEARATEDVWEDWADRVPDPRERYRPEGELGRGGMGIVERAWDRTLRRPLAIKVLRATPPGAALTESELLAAHRRQRFLNEVRITANLDHPGVAPLYDVGVDAAQRAFFTMRLVAGETFDVVVERVHAGHGAWTMTRALNVLLRVCETVGYAHERGIVHRDLKPANLMVGRFGEAYVMDWGAARRVDEAEAAAGPVPDTSATEDGELRTRDGDVIGTPAYMPPEQARGELERIGPPSDVYALGAILYHLLGGRPPYVQPDDEPTSRTILERVLAGPPEPIEQVARDTPPELLAICQRAMARELAQRYESVSELADDLRAYLEGRVVGAYETGALAELQKWIARNRGLAAALGAIVLLVVGGSIAVGWVMAVKNREIGRQFAEQERIAHNSLVAQSFYRDILWEALPRNSGPEVTMLTAIERKTEHAEDILADDPESLALFHLTASALFQSARRLDDSERHRLRALSLVESNGLQDSELGRLLLEDAVHPEFRHLTRLAVDADLIGAADAPRPDLEHLEELSGAIERSYSDLAPDDIKRAEAVLTRATVADLSGDHQEVVRLIEGLLARSWKSYDPERGDDIVEERRAAWLNNLSYSLAQLGEFDRAVERAREAVALFERLRADQPWELGIPLTHLGGALMKAGEPEEARDVTRRGLALLSSSPHADQEVLIAARANLVFILARVGEFAAAMDELETVSAAVPEDSRVAGEMRDWRAEIVDLWGQAEAESFQRGGLPEAEARARAELAVQRAIGAEDGPELWRAELRVADALRAAGRGDEALPWSRSVCERVEATDAAPADALADAYLVHARVLRDLGRSYEALDYVEGALDRASSTWRRRSEALACSRACRADLGLE